MKKIKLWIYLFIISFKYSLLVENETLPFLYIDIHESQKNQIGVNGTVIFYPDYCSDEIENMIDTNKKPYFKSNISDVNYEEYEINCGPWKDKERFFIFCDLKETIPKGHYFIKFNQTFRYLDYQAFIISDEKLMITKTDEDIIDLYSNIQNINVTKDIDIYNIKFQITSYNKERLYLSSNNIIQLDCKQNSLELLCPINKSILEGHTSQKTEITIMSLYKDGNMRFFDLIPSIEINFVNYQKTDIYLGIKKLLTNYAGINSAIAYETNITNIKEVYSGSFELSFNGASSNLSCNLVKGESSSLLIICYLDYGQIQEEILALKEIKNEIKLNEISNVYNFIIQPINNNESISYVNKKYCLIYNIYPNTLNFKEKDSIEIELLMENPNDLTGITFNENSEDLNCVDQGNLKKCTVPKKHFKEEKKGYYYIKYNGYNNTKFISYENFPIKIILSEDEVKNHDNKTLIIIISIFGTILLIAVIIFIIYCIKKRKNDNLEADVKSSKLEELVFNFKK